MDASSTKGNIRDRGKQIPIESTPDTILDVRRRVALRGTDGN